MLFELLKLAKKFNSCFFSFFKLAKIKFDFFCKLKKAQKNMDLIQTRSMDQKSLPLNFRPCPGFYKDKMLHILPILDLFFEKVKFMIFKTF